ncbi:hypothetical protein MTBBW1_410034 [Desulfamplus magnetovallimortis]|uniref:Uncharacterized protein n=1 Tax=Desulfamplus magnetovallimortis TaxID=1246637 RepID=A0A1W1HGS3_9BACT|nr:hypothetical protein MTBBW1_410034 [Desulfamplus magnetovallimortis]
MGIKIITAMAAPSATTKYETLNFNLENELLFLQVINVG